MNFEDVKRKYIQEFKGDEVKSVLGYKVEFPLDAIKHAFYNCPPPNQCPNFKPSIKSFRHCKHSKQNCSLTKLSIERVNNMPLIKSVITKDIIGPLRVYVNKSKKREEHIYIYMQGPPYFVVVCYSANKKDIYYFKTAKNLSENGLRKDILSYKLLIQWD